MTVEYGPTRFEYDYAGLGEYEFTCYVSDSEHVTAKHVDDLGFVTELEYDLDYNVVVNAPDGPIGGTIEVISSATSDALTGGAIILDRALPIEQPRPWATEGFLNLPKLELSLDEIVMMIQQLNSLITASFSDYFTFRGAWTADTYYDAMNVIFYNNTYFMAKARFTSSTEFNEDNWTEVFNLQTVYDAAESAAQSAYEATTSNTAVQISEDVVVAAESVVVASEAVVVAAETVCVDSAAIAVASANAAATILSSANRVDAMAEDAYVATAGQTNFVLSNAVDPNNIIVFLNTRKMKYGASEDYLFVTSLDSVTEIVFNSAMIGGEEIEIVTFNTRTSPNASEVWPTLSTEEVRGGVSGLVLSRGGDNTLSVSEGFCRSGKNEAWLSISAQDVAIPAVAGYYVAFAMVDGYVRVTTDSTGSDLADLYKRRIGVVVVNALGVLTEWTSSGDEVWFSDFDDLTCLASLSGVPTTIPLSTLLPVDMIESVTFGANGPTGQSGVVYISSSDSSNVVNTMLIESGSVWGSGGKPVPVNLAANAHVSFGAGALAVHVVKLSI